MTIGSKSKEEVVHEFRMQSLQEAAMRVIARKGLAAATMQDIADEAGVAKGTIYLYYKDRDALLDKTFENAMTTLHSRIDVALEAEGPLEQRLRGALRQLFEFFRENGEFFRLYMSHRLPEGTPQEQSRQQRHCDFHRHRIEKFSVLLAAAMDAGEIRRMDPLRLAIVMTEGTNGIVVERVMEPSPAPVEADVDLVMNVMFDGVRMNRSQS